MKAVLVQCLVLAALVAASPDQKEMKANRRQPGTAAPMNQASAVSPNGKKTLQVRQVTVSRFEGEVSSDGKTGTLDISMRLESYTVGKPRLDCGWEDDTRFWIIINDEIVRLEWREGHWRSVIEPQKALPEDRPNVRPMPSPSPDLPSKDLPSPRVDVSQFIALLEMMRQFDRLQSEAAQLHLQKPPPHQPPNVRPMPSPSPDFPSKELPSPPVAPSPGEDLSKAQ